MVGARGDVAAAGEHRDAPAGAGPAVVAAAAAVGARCFAASTATGDEEEEQVVLPSSSGPSVNHSAFASADSKPYLGGYRNAAIGAVYHHAATQTDAAANHPRRQRGPQASTATQTGQPRSCGVQCPREASTQCPRPGWAEDVAQGRVVELGGQWEPAEQVVARRAKAALAIQRCVRGWLARRCAAAMRQAQQELEVFVAEQQARSQAAAEQQRAHEVRRRMQPRTPADFVLLYDELAMWWGQEQEKIAAAEGVTEEERQEARRVLLAKETKLLQTIDRLKQAAAPLVRAERTAKQLAAMEAPRRWQLADGPALEVATPATLRAGELAGTYRALVAADGASLDARLAALLAVKYHAKAYDCSLTREIVGLVDREADLLNRGRDPASMAGLRVRLANSFLQFVQSEHFNPQATAAKPAAIRQHQQQQQYRFTERNARMAGQQGDAWQQAQGGGVVAAATSTAAR